VAGVIALVVVNTSSEFLKLLRELRIHHCNDLEVDSKAEKGGYISELVHTAASF
jgi:hypothetical protein